MSSDFRVLPLPQFVPEGLTVWDQVIAKKGHSHEVYQRGEDFLKKGADKEIGGTAIWRQNVAFLCFQQAALLDHAGAICKLGRYYLEGKIVDQSTEKAQTCFLHATAKNNAEAYYLLGVVWEKKIGGGISCSESLCYFDEAGKLGHVAALMRLAVIYDLGIAPVKQSDLTAFDYYKKAAQLGDGNAQLKTAQMLETGRGCRKSESEAQAWYKKAAEGKERALASKAAEDNQGLF